MKSLIVDDEFTSRILLEKFLSPYGECDIVSDGHGALQASRSAYEEGSPYDLICLDIVMPDLDGQDVLKRIRAYEKLRGIEYGEGVKIVMTSSLTNLNVVFDSYAEWCNDYLTKPLDQKMLIETLRRLKLVE